MEFEYSDITIINNETDIYKLNKIMLKRIPYFKIILSNKFIDSKDDIIKTTFNKNYFDKLLKDIYDYKHVELCKVIKEDTGYLSFGNFDIEYLNFVNYLGLDYDVELFHKQLENHMIMCRDNEEQLYLNLDILEYIVTVTKLRWSLRFIRNYYCYDEKKTIIKKNYKLLGCYLDMSYGGNDKVNNKNMFEKYFRNEILILCKSEYFYDLHNLLKYFSEFIDEEINIEFIKNYKYTITNTLIDYWMILFNNYIPYLNLDIFVTIMKKLECDNFVLSKFVIIMKKPECNKFVLSKFVLSILKDNYEKIDRYVSDDNKSYFEKEILPLL